MCTILFKSLRDGGRLMLCIALSMLSSASAFAQFGFAMPDFQQMMNQAEAQAKAQYEATGPGVILRDSDGNSAIVKNVNGLPSGSYLFIKIKENGAYRIYRPTHTEKSLVSFPSYAKGDGCVLNAQEDYITLTTPRNSYVFTAVQPLQGSSVPFQGTLGGQMGGNQNNSSPNSHKVCRSCNGTGKCGACHGAGYYYAYGNRVDCTICSPSNGRICNVCNGTGHW